VGIFDRIKNAIWGKSQASAAPIPAPNQKPITTASSTPTLKPSAAPSTSAGPTPAAPTQAAPTQPAGSGSKPVDVEAMLDAIVKKKGQKLKWRQSIVDLMKALDLDSSLANRKELASELGYDGDKSNSAAMNIWLHKAVMRKLSENGGRVPPELMD
jgi:hypothetical protein